MFATFHCKWCAGMGRSVWSYTARDNQCWGVLDGVFRLGGSPCILGLAPAIGQARRRRRAAYHRGLRPFSPRRSNSRRGPRPAPANRPLECRCFQGNAMTAASATSALGLQRDSKTPTHIQISNTAWLATTPSMYRPERAFRSPDGMGPAHLPQWHDLPRARGRPTRRPRLLRPYHTVIAGSPQGVGSHADTPRRPWLCSSAHTGTSARASEDHILDEFSRRLIAISTTTWGSRELDHTGINTGCFSCHHASNRGQAGQSHAPRDYLASLSIPPVSCTRRPAWAPRFRSQPDGDEQLTLHARHEADRQDPTCFVPRYYSPPTTSLYVFRNHRTWHTLPAKSRGGRRGPCSSRGHFRPYTQIEQDPTGGLMHAGETA